MIKQIVHDTLFLAKKSLTAVKTDAEVGTNLLDTLKAHSIACVGMAANMIGEPKRIIAINDNDKYVLMYNPEIIKKEMPYQTEEGCLSLIGVRKTLRYKLITVKYQDENFNDVTASFFGFSAQIIQHEIDHCNGIII